MTINLELGENIYHTDNGGTLAIDLYKIDNAKFRATIVPDPNNIDLNGFDTGAIAFEFSVTDRDNLIPGTNVVLHYDPQP
jgi:hypothetical protein